MLVPLGLMGVMAHQVGNTYLHNGLPKITKTVRDSFFQGMPLSKKKQKKLYQTKVPHHIFHLSPKQSRKAQADDEVWKEKLGVNDLEITFPRITERLT